MYRPQSNVNSGADQQYQFSATTPSYGYSPFSASVPGIIESQYQNSPRHLSPRPLGQQSPPHRRKASSGSHGIIRGISRSMSPGLSTATSSRFVPFTPTDRALPSKHVTQETITDAYVAFILYCNPNFPLDVDTQTLRTTFQSPPKSDNKEFETFRLFELIQKLDAKEIKTWAQLALDLGVEPPDTSKGQSVQKVQQYTVRLKRWMRAMHVDAFFEYLLGKEHPYFTEIPPPSDPHPTSGRDGVVAEEDLAIRALNPYFRPKRGRRRNSDVDQDWSADTASASKQPRLIQEAPHALSATPHPMTMSAFSAHPNSAQDPWAVASAVTPQTFAPWANRSAAPQSAATPSHFRWQVHESSHNPSTPHPMSAHPTSMPHQTDSSFENEPKSAITPSTRRRKRHGPAVSSAWPSTNGPGAKPRGRPPASRNVQDGPFTTFPADPGNGKSTEHPFTPAVTTMERVMPYEEQPIVTTSATITTSDGLSKPGRLSLQVPPHTGGPVRLATPPRVLVNGETNVTDENSLQISDARLQPPPTIIEKQRAVLTVEREIPGFSYEVLKRTLASVLLRANLTGRQARLSGDEAKRLADSVLERFNLPRADTDIPRDDIARLTAASWLGMGDHLNVPFGPATSQNQEIAVTRFRTDAEGYEEIVAADNVADDDNIREVFDFSWTVTMGGCSGVFKLKGLALSDSVVPAEPDIHSRIIQSWLLAAKQIGNIDSEDLQRLKQGINVDRNVGPTSLSDDQIDWKSKYRALEFASKMAEGEFDRFRKRIIDQLFDAVIR